MKEFLKKQLINKKKHQVAALIAASLIAITGCGASVDKDFAADTTALIGTMDTAITQADTPDMQDAVKLYLAKWGEKATSKKETEAIKHIGQASGYLLLYSVEKDDSKRDELRKEYADESQAAKDAIE